MMSAEADGSADGADEAEQEQRFARCRPLAPADSARWRASEQHRLGRIFYGNDNFFIFFRLHQHLYDRQDPMSSGSELPAAMTSMLGSAGADGCQNWSYIMIWPPHLCCALAGIVCMCAACRA